jgi:L-alanine-DL-glutamate epimerase-like enolase superfamily enzyme
MGSGRTGLPTDVRVVEAEAFFSVERPRAGFQFGNAVAGDLTLCHVRARVENRRGQVADGWGAIFLSHYWAFPSRSPADPTKDALMRRAVEALCERARWLEPGHPVALFREMERDLEAVGQAVGRALAAPEPPRLALLVCAAPLDAAIHDAFGNVNGIDSYAGYGPEHCRHDLAAWLGPAFRGRYIADYLRAAPLPRVPIAHTVGGLDPLRATRVAAAAEPPIALADWVRREGLARFKVKLGGGDLAHDLDRLIEVHRVAREAWGAARRGPLRLSVDLNEQCDDPAYPLELLARLRAEEPEVWLALDYIEQPTGRDLQVHGHDMRRLAAAKPVVLDEGLTRLADLDRALTLGWSGIALKTCKCHSLMLLLNARAVAGRLLCMVQDLSNPGIALLHSIGLAARLPALMGTEANARQYYPHVSSPESAAHPGVMRIEEGSASTATLGGPGLGYRVAEIRRALFQPGA